MSKPTYANRTVAVGALAAALGCTNQRLSLVLGQEVTDDTTVALLATAKRLKADPAWLSALLAQKDTVLSSVAAGKALSITLPTLHKRFKPDAVLQTKAGFKTFRYSEQRITAAANEMLLGEPVSTTTKQAAKKTAPAKKSAVKKAPAKKTTKKTTKQTTASAAA